MSPPSDCAMTPPFDDAPPTPMTGRGWLSTSIVWAVAVAAALFGLMAYSQRPGSVLPPPSAEAAGIRLDPTLHTLVIAVHPRCACTRASVRELERLMVRVDKRVVCRVLMYRPIEADGEWSDGSIRRHLERLPNTVIEADLGGQKARRLGALVSGSTVLYRPDGTPVFWGGITVARAHEGDNLGSDSITALILNTEPAVRVAKVYGCSLAECTDE